MPPRPRENPFVSGEVITEPAHFVDRQGDLDALEHDMCNGRKVFLLSPRRFGKSSLVSVAFRRLAEQHRLRTVIIPLNSYVDYTQFLSRYASRLIHAAGPYDKVRTWLDRFWRTTNPRVGVDPLTGEPHLSFGARRPERTPIPEEVFKLPATLTAHGKFRMAICLDEFQAIRAFGGEQVESCLRNAVQYQRQVGYVFAGSQPSLMAQAVMPKRPFYKAGPVRFLGKIPSPAWTDFLVDGFAQTGITLGTAALQQLLTLTELVPADVQRLAYEVWTYCVVSGLEAVDPRDVLKMVDQIVATESTLYQHRWDQLPPGQRAVLRAIAAGAVSALHSDEVRKQYRLGSPSSVQTALRALEAADLIDREERTRSIYYHFLEPFFGAWIRRQGGMEPEQEPV